MMINPVAPTPDVIRRHAPEFQKRVLRFLLEGVFNTTVIYAKIMIIPDRGVMLLACDEAHEFLMLLRPGIGFLQFR